MVRSTVVEEGEIGEETEVRVVVVVVGSGSTSRFTLMQPLVKAMAAMAKARLMLCRKVDDFISIEFHLEFRKPGRGWLYPKGLFSVAESRSIFTVTVIPS